MDQVVEVGTVTEEDLRRAIVAEVAKWARPSGLESWQFTVYDYLPLSGGASLSQSSTRLRALAAAGKLKTAMVTHRGKRIRAYWRQEDEPAKD